MRKILTALFLLIVFTSKAQDSNLFNRMPKFLATASPSELNSRLKEILRFSITKDNFINIIYENTNIDRIGELDEIPDEIKKFKSKLLMAKNETPSVKFFEWTDCKQRSELYPCGLIVIFRNDRISHIWLNFN